jgi:hypothetical protein
MKMNFAQISQEIIYGPNLGVIPASSFWVSHGIRRVGRLPSLCGESGQSYSKIVRVFWRSLIIGDKDEMNLH